MSTNNELKRRFVLAVDEVIPPAPALEARVYEGLRRDQRRSNHEGQSAWVLKLGPGLRLAAGLAAFLVASTIVTTLLFSTEARKAIGPSDRPAPGYRFTPKATTRSASWPKGGPVPAGLEGCWQLQRSPQDPSHEVCLGQYSFDIGQGTIVGNAVVNGAEIDLFTNACGSNVGKPYDAYLYTVDGSMLALVNVSRLLPRGVGLADSWSSCGWELDGTYSRLVSP